MQERLFSLLSLVSWVSYFGHVLLVSFSSSVSCILVLSFQSPSLPPRGKLSLHLLPFSHWFLAESEVLTHPPCFLSFQSLTCTCTCLFSSFFPVSFVSLPVLISLMYSSLQNCPNVWHVETNWLVTQKIHMLRF